MNVPVGKKNQIFKLETGYVPQNGINIPVFEVSIDKGILLYDQDKNLVKKEKEMKSVEEVNGPSLKVGSMDEVNTNGNWPKIIQASSNISETNLVLSIQVGLNGLSFLVLDLFTKKVELIETLSFQKKLLHSNF